MATLFLPPVQPPTDGAVVPFPLNQQCVAMLHAQPSVSVLLLTAPNPPPTERSQAWCDAVVQRLQPTKVHVVCTVESHDYVGDSDPTSNALAFVLANRAATLPEGVPLMPQDLLLQGAAAALLLQCQVRMCACVLSCNNAMYNNTLSATVSGDPMHLCCGGPGFAGSRSCAAAAACRCV